MRDVVTWLGIVSCLVSCTERPARMLERRDAAAAVDAAPPADHDTNNPHKMAVPADMDADVEPSDASMSATGATPLNSIEDLCARQCAMLSRCGGCDGGDCTPVSCVSECVEALAPSYDAACASSYADWLECAEAADCAAISEVGYLAGLPRDLGAVGTCPALGLAVECGALSQRTCTALDCDSRAVCALDGDALRCNCPDGFIATPSIAPKLRCEDIDECQDGTPCGEGRRCVNTLGSYYCDCSEGQALSAQGECIVSEGCVTAGEPALKFKVRGPGAGRVTVATSRCTWQCHVGSVCEAYVPEGETPHITAEPNPYSRLDSDRCAGLSLVDCARTRRELKFAVVHNIAFVTSTLHSGNLGGIEGANEVCNERARAAALPGDDWVALIDAQGAAVHWYNGVENAQGWVRTDGLPLVERLTEGRLQYPLDVDEYGVRITDSLGAWTGVTWSDPVPDCGGWTSDLALSHGHRGNPHRVDADFLSDESSGPDADSCEIPRHLYCASADAIAPLPVRVEFPGRMVIASSAFLPEGSAEDALERADAQCQHHACQLGLTGIGEPSQCDISPGTFRTFRALLSTTAQAAISRVAARDEPWITLARHPLTRTGAELGLGQTLTAIGGEQTGPFFAGYAIHPGELALPDQSCGNWTDSSGGTALVDGRTAPMEMLFEECGWGALICVEE